MSEPSEQSAAPGERAVVRDVAGTAPGRCFMYALFSDIAASPFDSEPAIRDEQIELDRQHLPYELPGLSELLRAWRSTGSDELKREYSGLFEVGSQGPPVPIREDLHRNQPAGVREDIVRFYEFFGYGLDEKFQWAPDHLSVELEFMHFLCYQEAEQSGAENGDPLSFQLAQHDFAERHLVSWVSELAERVAAQQPDSLYAQLIAALSEFQRRDFEWQQSTID